MGGAPGANETRQAAAPAPTSTPGQTSWWPALRASKASASEKTALAGGDPTAETLVRQRAAATLAVLGAVAVVMALAIGLRGAPQAPVDATVAGSIVISRALMALGLIGLALGFFRQAERLYFTK